MATPIRLTRNYYKIEKGKNRPSNPDDVKKQQLDLKTDDALFSIYETDNVSLVFDFSEDEYEIQIEDLETGELVKVLPGQERDLSFFDEENAFFPGYFDLDIRSKISDERKRYFFVVRPKQTTMGDVLYLRSYVNQYYDGLSLDLEKKRKMKVARDDNSGFGHFSSYNFIRMYFPDLMNYITRYIKKKPDLLIRKEVISPKFSRVSPKSIRWLVQKGYIRNRNITEPEMLLTTKTAFTYDNEQNRVFKSHLVFWDNELANLLYELSHYEKQIEKNIARLEIQLAEKTEKSNEASQNDRVVKQFKKQLTYEIDDLKKKISSQEAQSSEYRDIYEILHRYKTFTENIRYNTWIRNVGEEENYAHKKIANKELLLIKEYKDRYLGTRRRITFGKREKIDYFAEKNSPKLFETYLYILLIEILSNNGFEIDEDLLPMGDLMYTLSEQSKVILTNKEGMKCEIIYDKVLEDYNEGFVESDFCSINSSHRQPDFILSFKDMNDRVVNAVIIEAKWRRLANIFDEHGDTEVMVTLKDYLSLAYYDTRNNKINRDVFSKVIAIYPDANETMTNTFANQITFCGIKIGKNIETTNNYAYMDSIIKKCIIQ